jgi:hypothetical protein
VILRRSNDLELDLLYTCCLAGLSCSGAIRHVPWKAVSFRGRLIEMQPEASLTLSRLTTL